MIYHIYRLPFICQIDSRLYEMERQLEFYRLVLLIMSLIVVILIMALLIQRIVFVRGRESRENRVKDSTGKRRGKRLRGNNPYAGADPASLPDPGNIFRFTHTEMEPGERVITIGSRHGSIRTWSTEIEDEHLEVHIEEIDDSLERELYQLPERLYAEYRVTLKRSGNVLIHYPGLEGYRRMEQAETIYITRDPDRSGGPCFESIEARQPVRFRLGRELESWDRFTDGYFEFHLYVQDHETDNERGMPRVGKYFMIRLYRIYPGYDLASPDSDGLYPMLDPFDAAGL